MRELIDEWTAEADSDDLLRLWERVEWLRGELFDSYEPASFTRFDDRLAAWLSNVVQPDEKKAMFRLLHHLFFVGREQFASLARAAFNDAVTRWIIDQEDLDIRALDIGEGIDKAIEATWFCPITDSMSINTFLKLNMIGGHNSRPDWRSLQTLGDPAKIQDFVKRNKIRHLVLLEDFVGSGSQMDSTVVWARGALPGIPILVAPLICCPVGARRGHDLSKHHANLAFEPVLTLRPELFVQRQPQTGEKEPFAQIRALSEENCERFAEKFHEPFGFEDTGALVVLHTNCPDNTLPLIHDDGAAWKALFPRISRTDAA